MSVDTPTEYRVFQSADEAEQWAEIHYPDLCGIQRENNLNYQYLYRYAGSAYKVYNADLRYDEDADDDSTLEIQRITDVIGRYELPQSVVAYRYTHKQVLKLLFRGERPRPGLRFADKAFFSTSLVKSSIDDFKKKYNCNCLLKLYLPKGIHGAYISLKDTASILNEQELLLQRNTEFEIVKVHRFRIPMMIECKAISNPTSEV